MYINFNDYAQLQIGLITRESNYTDAPYFIG